MYCANCGAKIPDNASFCPACGKPVRDTAQPGGSAEQSADNTERQYESTERQYESTERQYGGTERQPRGGSGTYADAVILMGKSSLTLAFTVFLSVSTVFNIIGIFFYSSQNIFISLLSVISEIIICVGCWLVYTYSSRNRTDLTGFSVLRVGVLIYLIVQLLIPLISIYEISYFYSGFARLAAIIVGLAIWAVFIWCCYNLYRITNDARKILMGEAVEWRVPLSCIVILIVLTVCDLFYTIFIMFSGQWIVVLQYLITVVLYVLAIVILFRIRKENNLSA